MKEIHVVPLNTFVWNKKRLTKTRHSSICVCGYVVNDRDLEKESPNPMVDSYHEHYKQVLMWTI